MTTAELRQRPSAKEAPASSAKDVATDPTSTHPKAAPAAPAPKHGRPMQLLRAVLFAIYFNTCCLVIHATQLLGSPLYIVSRDVYYAYMSLTKQSFGLLLTTMSQWWAPTIIRISGDASVAAELSLTPDGRVQCAFPERLVMIANHQIYTDWIYLWWVAYTNSPTMHGHIYIILKESIRWIPIIGTGCMFFSFIFMSRKMAVDQPRMAHRLSKLKKSHSSPVGDEYYDPMWLLLFPEGTNLSRNGRAKSASWAAKKGWKDMEHQLLPRSAGTFYCLNELKGTLEYVYDCTVAYEGIPRGAYGEEHFSLAGTYFQGNPPKSVNFYWRRFTVADIPLDDAEKFDEWLRARWVEKDALMEQYLVTGRFPANAAGIKGHIETSVRTQHWWEFLKIFVMLGAFGLIFNFILKAFRGLRAH